MKNLTLAIVLLVMGATLHAQTVNDKQLLYEKKVKTYTIMKSAGLVTAMSSGICLISGAALISNANGEFLDHSGIGAPSLTTGGALFLSGALLVAPGIIFTIIGTKKLKYYSEKLENLNVGLLYLPEQKGISICYRF